MTFNPVFTINAAPNVRIFFEGLLMLKSTTDGVINRCDVHAVNHSTHNMFVDVSIDEAQPTYPFLRIAHNDLHSAGLEISTVTRAGTATPSDVKKYVPAPPLPTSQPFSFEDAVDFAKLHPRSTFDHGGAHAGTIRIRNGVLYTAKRQDVARLRRDPRECIDRKVASILAAGIEFNPAQTSLRLTWRSRSIDLPFGDDPLNTKYIIAIGNLCPSPPMPAVNDFGVLYNCINRPPGDDKYALDFKSCMDLTETSPRVPCIPGVDGG
jgi:hypothetical protein